MSDLLLRIIVIYVHNLSIGGRPFSFLPLPASPNRPMSARLIKFASKSTSNSLSQLPVRRRATIVRLIEPSESALRSSVTARLAELGFLPGEFVTVLRRGPGGREPIAVQVGDTVFALRTLEAACIEVGEEPMPQAA